MREIKFRAWDKDNKFMSNVKVIDFKNGFVWTEDIHLEDGYVFEDVEIMQCTGLTDKNGMEIYEGDIIHLFGKGYYDGVDYNGCIQFLDGGFCVTDGYKEWGLRRYDLSRCDLELEVIGNIYENPELLSKTN